MKKKDIQDMNQYGELLYAYETYDTFKKYYKEIKTFFTGAIIGGAIVLSFIVFFLINEFTDGATKNVIVLVIMLILGLVMLFLVYIIIKKTNWLGIFERGIFPTHSSLKYAFAGKKFFSYSEVKKIIIEKDEFLDYDNNKHCWIFKFMFEDGGTAFVGRSSLDTYDSEEAIEREYQILKHIMNHIGEKDSFTAEEIGVQQFKKW